jgi:hypothetical protein
MTPGTTQKPWQFKALRCLLKNGGNAAKQAVSKRIGRESGLIKSPLLYQLSYAL